MKNLKRLAGDRSGIRNSRLLETGQIILLVFVFCFPFQLLYGDDSQGSIFKGNDNSLFIEIPLDSFNEGNWKTCNVVLENRSGKEIRMTNDVFVRFLFPDKSCYEYAIPGILLLPDEKKCIIANPRYNNTKELENHLKVGITTVSTLVELLSNEITRSGSAFVDDFVIVSFNVGERETKLSAIYR